MAIGPEASKYKFKSEHLGRLLEERMLEIAREERQREFDEGIQEGKLFEVRRLLIMVASAKLGELDPGLRRRIEEATDYEHLHKLLLEVSIAQDPATVEEILEKI